MVTAVSTIALALMLLHSRWTIYKQDKALADALHTMQTQERAISGLTTLLENIVPNLRTGGNSQ